MATTNEIPRAQWEAFCEQYSRQHAGWLASLSQREEPCSEYTERATSPVASGLPFQGLTFEKQGNEIELRVSVGEGNQTFTCRLIRPFRILPLETDTGEHEGLCMSDETGRSVQLRFRVPAKPDVLDGFFEA